MCHLVSPNSITPCLLWRQATTCIWVCYRVLPGAKHFVGRIREAEAGCANSAKGTDEPMPVSNVVTILEEEVKVTTWTRLGAYHRLGFLQSFSSFSVRYDVTLSQFV